MKVFIYSGIQGAGKTTEIKRRHPASIVCSTDDYFMSGGEYRFDPMKLGEAHAQCLRMFVELVRSNEIAPPDGIIVDNTNTSIAEIAPYASVALAYGHDVTVVTIHCDPEVAAARNVHGVPVESVRLAAERIASRDLPPWWKQEAIPAGSR